MTLRESDAISYTPEHWPVQGKTALVTGGGSGIGLEFTKLLVKNGCNVLIADLGLRSEAQEFMESTSKQATRVAFHQTDVSVWTQLEAAVAACLETFGRMDIVCPGAGVYEPTWSAFWEPPGTAASKDAMDANSYKQLDINITHPIRLSQLAVGYFLSNKVPGRIIHISSLAAQGPAPLTPLYCASKAAISAFVRSLVQLEPRFGIRVNGVAPGVVRTPLWTDPKHAEKLRYVDEGKDIWVTPEEVAVGMLRLLEEPDLPGGTILEIGAGSTRKVELLNDPGPMKEAPGLRVSNAKESWEEMCKRLKQGDWGTPTK